MSLHQTPEPYFSSCEALVSHIIVYRSTTVSSFYAVLLHICVLREKTTLLSTNKYFYHTSPSSSYNDCRTAKSFKQDLFGIISNCTYHHLHILPHCILDPLWVPRTHHGLHYIHHHQRIHRGRLHHKDVHCSHFGRIHLYHIHFCRNHLFHIHLFHSLHRIHLDRMQHHSHHLDRTQHRIHLLFHLRILLDHSHLFHLRILHIHHHLLHEDHLHLLHPWAELHSPSTCVHQSLLHSFQYKPSLHQQPSW
mmetsp:Transcript_10345/g.19347  ORF Transcript_10345/g.19347 Transcript_10345/m.19347 type:complete len:249 (-) Transcript_10345:677-1423(-)